MEILYVVASGLATLLFGFLLTFIVYARWNYGRLEKIKGLMSVATPYFLGGSDPFPHTSVMCLADIDYARKYGKVYGFYEGRSPVIVITDLELIKKVLVTDFSFFNYKSQPDTGSPWFNETMDILDYERWKVVRNAVSAQFTTSKIRHMGTTQVDAIEDWAAVLAGRIGAGGFYDFDIKYAFKALTSEVVARCLFGFKLNLLEESNNKFFEALNEITFDGAEGGWILSLIRVCPLIMKFLPSPPSHLVAYFVNYLKEVLKQSPPGEHGQVLNFADAMNDLLAKCETREFKEARITEVTVMSQALVLLIAGSVTTGMTLPVLAYFLATRKDVMARVEAELGRYLERHDGIIRPDTISELEYLGACLQEVLRLHPANIRLERACSQDWSGVYQGSDGPKTLLLKKGTRVQVPLYPLHYDEAYFEEPHAFKPERFLPACARKYPVWMPFGIGPHNCVGTMFAKQEILLALAVFLKKFNLEAIEETRLRLYKGRDFINNCHPILVRIRQKNEHCREDIKI